MPKQPTPGLRTWAGSGATVDVGRVQPEPARRFHGAFGDCSPRGPRSLLIVISDPHATSVMSCECCDSSGFAEMGRRPDPRSPPLSPREERHDGRDSSGMRRWPSPPTSPGCYRRRYLSHLARSLTHHYGGRCARGCAATDERLESDGGMGSLLTGATALRLGRWLAVRGSPVHSGRASIHSGVCSPHFQSHIRRVFRSLRPPYSRGARSRCSPHS